MEMNEQQQIALLKLLNILEHGGCFSEAERNNLIAKWYDQYDGAWFDEWKLHRKWEFEHASRH
jgi:hypothetical protein